MAAQSNAQLATTPRELTITRIFDAPRELVYRLWTDPRHLARWWGPRYFTNPRVEVDVRPGGRLLIHMQGPDGTIYPMHGIFNEVVPLERLVFTSTAAEGEDGETFLEDVTTVTFADAGGKTRVTMHARVTMATAEAEGALAGMEQGWNESLDKLADALAPIRTVRSADGTIIAFDQTGGGPAIILVAGALGFRAHEMGHDLAQRLAPHFTVINYDRRGRGDSTDTPPYAVQREVEDIDALIEYAGGSAYLYGISSGAVLALEAASKLGSKVTKLVMYEPPFIFDGSRPAAPADYVRQLESALAAGDRGKAVEIFMVKAVGVPEEFVGMMRSMPAMPAQEGVAQPPSWADMEAIAHTLVYDGLVMGDTIYGRVPDFSRWAGKTAPTVVVTGGNSEPFFASAAKALTTALPNITHRVLEGQDHAVAPGALAPLLIEILS